MFFCFFFGNFRQQHFAIADIRVDALSVSAAKVCAGKFCAGKFCAYKICWSSFVQSQQGTEDKNSRSRGRLCRGAGKSGKPRRLSPSKASQTGKKTSANPTATPTPMVDEKLFGAMRGARLGPFRGGRVLAVTGVPGEPNIYYFGGVAGGVWKSIDTGGTWTPIFDEQRHRVDRSHCGCRVRPQRDLCRHRRSLHPRKHLRMATASTSRWTAARPGRTSA